MRHIPFKGLCRTLTQRTLAQPPSVWGKLPAYGDYVHHNVSLSAQEAWHEWVQSYWHRRPVSRSAVAARGGTGADGWMHVTQAPARPDLSDVPVAFVLPPGHLPHMDDVFVQGVMVPSEDKVGRACPLIIYQTVHRLWMQRTWASPWGPARHAPVHQDRSQGRHLLYWWARLAAHARQHPGLFPALVTAVEQVWLLHEPGWRNLVGAQARPASSAALEVLVQQFGASAGQDAAGALRGVSHLPWADWPERTLRVTEPLAAFWMQDAEGGYVQASDKLLQLWGVRA